MESYSNYDFNKAFNINFQELIKVKQNFNYYESLSSENPFLGNYIERVMKDNDPEMEIEQSIVKSDEVFRICN